MALDREGMWQGIRDWFRPAASSSRETRRRGRPHVPLEAAPPAARERLAPDAPDTAALARPAGGGVAVLDRERDELELLEFLAADIDPVPADPAFRERLRAELWAMVLRDGAGQGSD